MGSGKGDRLYLTAETLETYFGAYGFEASDLQDPSNAYIFGHATSNSKDVWYDQAAQNYYGQYILPVMTNEHNGDFDAKAARTLQVYYLPGHSGTVLEAGHYGNDNGVNNDIDQHLNDDSLGFYTVSLNNVKGGLVDSSQTSKYPVIWRAKTTSDCTLPALKSGYEWLVVNPKTGMTLSNDVVNQKSVNTDGTITYTINSIGQPVLFYAMPTNVTIDFWAAVNGEWQMLARVDHADGVLLTDVLVDGTANDNQGDHIDRYYIKAETLEKIYSKFGFEKEDLDDVSNARIFPHRADADKISLWADAPVHTLADGTKVVLVTTYASDNHLYYVPQNVPKMADGTDNPHYSGVPYPAISPSQPTIKVDGVEQEHKNEWHEIPYTDATGSPASKEAARVILEENNFYGVIVEDPENKLTSVVAAELSSYKKDANAEHTISLPTTGLPAGYAWWIIYNDQMIPLSALNDPDNEEIAKHIKADGAVDEAGNQTYTVTLPVDGDSVGNIKFSLGSQSGAKVETMNVRTVYWVSIDGEWKRIADEKTVDGQFTMGPYAGRYFVTADHLARVYAEYGFTTDMLQAAQNARMFPYRTSRQELTVWADNPAQKMVIDGKQTWAIPLRSETDKTGDNHVYYMPGNIIENAAEKPFGCLTGTGTGVDAGTKTAISVGPATVKNNHAEENAFYSVSVDNSVGGIANNEDGSKVPAKKILRKGTVAEYTVPALIKEGEANGFKWIVSDLNGVIIETEEDGVFEKPAHNPDGSKTYIIRGKDGNGIQHPIVFRVEFVDNYTFAYNADTLNQDMLVKVSSLNVVNQEIKQHGSITIDGESGPVGVVHIDENADSYTVRAPDQDALLVHAQEGEESKADNHPRAIFYHFNGWRIGWSDHILQAGAVVTKDELAGLSLNTSQIFRALWTPFDASGDIDTVNFYLSTDCEVRDYTGSGTTAQNKEHFTESLYAARVLKEMVPGQTNLWKASASLTQDTAASGSYMFRSVPVTDKTGYGADTVLRTSTRVPVVGDKPDYKVKLTAFPTDDEIFAELRKMDAADYAAKNITIDGRPVSQDELTTENFQIRWYTLKYHTSDGWHIDGVLVAKEARLVVTKTFSGDADAIAKVKAQGFHISVTHDASNNPNANGTAQVKDFDLVLRTRQEGDGNTNGEMGYTSYNAATDTYTWVLTGRQSYAYHLTENNYTIQKSSEDETDGSATEYHNVAEYRVTNLPGQNTPGYVPYEDSTPANNQVTVEPIPSDLPAVAQPTIAFRNTYMKAGMITLKKVDSATDSGLPVKFKLTRGTTTGGFTSDDTQPTLYRKQLTDANGNLTNTYEYSNNYDSEEAAKKDSYTLKVADSTIETGPNGQVYLKLAPAENGGDKGRTIYRLEEVVPEGYTGQRYYYVAIDSDGRLISAGHNASDVIGAEGDADKDTIGRSNAAPDAASTGGTNTDGSTTDEWVKADTTNAIITISNSSRLLTEVIAQKQWPDEGTKEEVTVQLLRNGAPVPDVLDKNGKVTTSYTAVLDETNSWTYKWTDLPLYIDGNLAQYSLREVKIGNTIPDATGNYTDYVVSYDAPKYAKYDTGTAEAAVNWQEKAHWENESNQTVYADHALLVVHNRKLNGDIMFAKVDGNGNALDGAEFTLYSDETCQTPVQVTITDESGNTTTKNATATSEQGAVQFAKMPDGTYYMKETNPPQDYYSDDSVYQIEVASGKVSITRVGGDVGTEINQVVNSQRVNLNLTKYAISADADYNTENRTPLAGAVFTLRRVENNVEQIYRENLTTDKDGKLTIADLVSGSYVLREEAAPAGYRLIEEGLAFTVMSDGQIELGVGDGDLPAGWVEFGPDVNISGPGLSELEEDNTSQTKHAYNVVAVDKATWYFPTTGGVGIYVPMLAGTCLLCAAAWLVWRKVKPSP